MVFIGVVLTLFLPSCSQPRSDLKKILPLYQVKGKPKPGDWLDAHEEKYMDIETYMHSKPSRPDSQKKFIYIYKLGENTRAEDSLLRLTCEYLELVFHLKTRNGHTFPVSCVPDSMKRMSNDTVVLQVNTHFVLDTLVSLPLPYDAAVGICFTKYDLYPADDWNFVFGQAYITERAGIWSFSRYGDANDPAEFKTVLRRTLKVAAHETGHMFSIRHCIRFSCDMNGSNSMQETDESPIHYCPDCLEKISWNIGFGLGPHFKNLSAFYQRNGLLEEAEFMEKNNLALKNE